ncbi:EAL domain-containing protein [Pediococcus inopinatus]|uniref:EAL domain-containing protein n=1 Tax=Pediococcus inopinatus TaxID=114090 RepID=UPI002B25849A|nr:EAL domain-containing protein [Pediococcus inopinatus]WPC16791.1 EAL domain-containing protein [Pediococcus inopinatus]
MYRYFIQPQLNKMNNSLIGYELLIRKHSDNGWQVPKLFSEIPAPVIADMLAETTAKLVLKIGSVSVNLNRTQMMNKQINAALIKAQDQLRPLKLNVELTEEPGDEAITNADLEPMFKRFIQRGMEICLDDVGTGDNQINEIEALFPYVSEIKFALQNFKESFQDPKIQAKVVYWRDIARKENLRFILEGIEDDTDDQLADDLEIDLRQGYYYGKPHLLKINADDPD